MSKRSVLWFRKGLRVHDNQALLDACDDVDNMFPVFCLDPWFISSGKMGANRINFLLESLQDLDKNLQARGSRLIILQGNPKEVIPHVLDQWSISKLCFEKDTEPYALERDAAISATAAAADVQVQSPVGHTLYDTDMLIKKNKGSAPKTMAAFEKLIDLVGQPPPPSADPPTEIPPVAEDLLSKAGDCYTDGGKVPSLVSLGYSHDDEDGKSPFKGGETEAMKRLDESLKDSRWVCDFEKPKGNPAAFQKPATTVLSPYLKFGCLSSRLFHCRLMEVYKGRKHTNPPVSLRGQLLWREFFYTVGYDTPNFHRMEGNEQVKQIPWVSNKEFEDAWEHGRTGFPWIDAIMNQLRAWGWMHHLARHSVACFLTRGDLWCHWETGRDVFDKYLIDGDHFINNANWQWLSCSNFFYQYFRVYSPAAFGSKYDGADDYIRHFVPALKDMPKKYIFEPWTAPLNIQQAAKCIIGKDYPHPIVDHAVVSKRNKDRLKAAYTAQKEGKPMPTIDGSDVAPPVAKEKRAQQQQSLASAYSKKQKTEPETSKK